MKKIIILVAFALLLTGCKPYDMDTYTDKDTCVMYLHRYNGGITVMYNRNGTIKTDQNCMRNK